MRINIFLDKRLLYFRHGIHFSFEYIRMEESVILWFGMSILAASFALNRRIGFFRAFIICLVLTPLIGLIVALISEKNSETLMKLKIAHDAGRLTDAEYERKVRKIVPQKGDKRNLMTGFSVVAIIALIVYWIFKFLMVSE